MKIKKNQKSQSRNVHGWKSNKAEDRAPADFTACSQRHLLLSQLLSHLEDPETSSVYRNHQPESPVGIDLAEQFLTTLPKTDLQCCLRLSYKREICQREKLKLSHLDCSFASLSLSTGKGFQGIPVSQYSAARQWPLQGRHLCNGRLHCLSWRQASRQRALPRCGACASRSHY